jgi:hypothetical protein
MSKSTAQYAFEGQGPLTEEQDRRLDALLGDPRFRADWAEWEVGDDHRWVPDADDRRRLGQEHAKAVAEVNGLPFLPAPLVAQTLVTAWAWKGDEDRLLDSFNLWMQRG